ncbi:MAG: NfeD family protein [Betaproteobacteria bacterium]|nr:NfeD family protein [Betaproteobacteria bacterium]MBI2959729.1 NfeD family protein [Betaproteobacteria bacterium]
MCHVVLVALPLVALSVFWLLPLSAAVPAFVVISAATAALYLWLYRCNQMPVLNGAEAMQHATGKVLAVHGRTAEVWVASELWSARFEGEITEGDLVQVFGMEGLELKVRKAARGSAGKAMIG